MAITGNTLRLIEEMRRLIDRLADGVVRDLTAAWVRAWDTIAPELVRALTELIQLGDGHWPSRSQVQRSASALHALETVQRALERLAGLAEQQIGGAVHNAVHGTTAAQAAIIDSQLPPRVVLPSGAVSVPAERLAAIVTRTIDQIHKAARTLAPDAVDAMKRELVRGVAKGSNPRETARQILRRTETVFNGGLSRALNIARTEILDAHRAAAQASQDAAADVLDGWVWTASLTPRTCAACWAMHGTVHPLDEPGPLDHQSGRCTRTPKTKSWADLGIHGVTEPDDVMASAVTEFANLPRADQLRILGPACLQLLDSGAITWADLAQRRTTSGWRPSYTPTPVRDLQPA